MQDTNKQSQNNPQSMRTPGDSNMQNARPMLQTQVADQKGVSPSPSGNDPSLVATVSRGRRFPGKKIIATIFVLLILIGGVATAVYLTQNQRLIRTQAWDCESYKFNISQDGTVTVRNEGTRKEPAQKVRVFINGELKATFDAPELKGGEAATLGKVDVPSDGDFDWNAEGTKDCKNAGEHEKKVTICHASGLADTTKYETLTIGYPAVYGPAGHFFENGTPQAGHEEDYLGPCQEATSTPTPTELPGATNTPTPTPSPTPTLPPQVTAQCNNVIAYDLNWSLLSTNDLASLKTGDKVRFAVSGTATTGSFDKARFTVNGTQRPEVTTKKPGSDEFYDEYTVPTGITTFTVSAQIHHSTLEWF